MIPRRLTHDERLQSLRQAIRGRLKLPRPNPRGLELREALIRLGCIVPAPHQACRDFDVCEMRDADAIEAAQVIFLFEEPCIAENILREPNSDVRVVKELRKLFKLSEEQIKTLADSHRYRRKIWRKLFPPEVAEGTWEDLQAYVDEGDWS